MPSYDKKVNVPGQSAQAIFDKVSVELKGFLDRAKLTDAKIEKKVAEKAFRVDSTLFSADILCQEGCVVVNGKISFMALPFKSKIDEGITQWLSRAFPQT